MGEVIDLAMERLKRGGPRAIGVAARLVVQRLREQAMRDRCADRAVLDPQDCGRGSRAAALNRCPPARPAVTAFPMRLGGQERGQE